MIRPDNLILWLVVASFAAICLFILAALVWFSLWRNAHSDPATGSAMPQTRRALIWTLTPVIVFALAVVPLMWLLYARSATPAADVTITVTGKMWYWTYEYSDRGKFSFNAPMLVDAAANLTLPGKYDHIVVPVGKTVRIVAVSSNVIYSWTIPSIGAEIEALPGRTSQSWFKAAQEGRYFGKCLELCGLPHAFRPIEVEVVSRERFDQWLAGARQKLNSIGARPRPSAQAR